MVRHSQALYEFLNELFASPLFPFLQSFDLITYLIIAAVVVTFMVVARPKVAGPLPQ